MRARLIPSDGGPPLELTKDLTLFGRDEDCDVRLDQKGVTIKGLMVQIEGKILVSAKGTLIQIKADGPLMESGAIVLIN